MQVGEQVGDQGVLVVGAGLTSGSTGRDTEKGWESCEWLSGPALGKQSPRGSLMPVRRDTGEKN